MIIDATFEEQESVITESFNVAFVVDESATEIPKWTGGSY